MTVDLVAARRLEEDQRLVLEELRDPETGLLDVRRRLTCDHRVHRGHVVTEAWYRQHVDRCTYEEVAYG